MIHALLVASMPLLLASLGALVSDFSGYLAVFLEGALALGSFLVWVFSVWSNSLSIGFLITMILTGFIGWLLSRFIRWTSANPFVSALALNLGVVGIIETVSVLLYHTKGVLRDPRFPRVDMYFFVWISFLIMILAYAVIYHTPIGLRLRASGRRPEVLLQRGIDPVRYRDGAWVVAAMLAALAGGIITVKVGAYTPGGTTGEGWIALVMVYLGFRRVWGVALAAIIFTFIERLGIEAQGMFSIPSTILLGLPSLLALLLYIISQLLRKE
ncbi:ABC transporter permease subunit [Gracilinema caldarium]|uniref:ABC-type transporter, integral membrane subunit n=1 Tax=Gracilinema caldarium (strain ATCC 51460 / DSM 7334 / H1) TaxID=744872 RepID=F8EZN0_GRAC1|nr:ABC transporter permease [Gracilinema caldarium]AEJ20754.1 ABC-type transporter, integral membrane subunit [Gracilinema caldarium DSM 7334]